MNDPVLSNSRDMIRRGSRSFASAARLFSRATRERAYMLYAWCRYCDDQIDGQELGFGVGVPDAAARVQRLQRLREATRRAIAGEPGTDAVFEGFRRVVQDACIPERYPMALLDGFGMDATGWRYRQFGDTLLYCYRVAGTVGVMMAHVMGVRKPGILERAADLGIAFQLTNIARDVMDDARLGRCYLPEAWLAEADVAPGAHTDAAQRERVVGVVQRLLTEADRYYASAREGLPALPFRSAWAVATALGIYREIGNVVLACGAGAWDRRAVIGAVRKLRHGLYGGLRALEAVTLDRRIERRPRESGLWLPAD